MLHERNISNNFVYFISFTLSLFFESCLKFTKYFIREIFMKISADSADLLCTTNPRIDVNVTIVRIITIPCEMMAFHFYESVLTLYL